MAPSRAPLIVTRLAARRAVAEDARGQATGRVPVPECGRKMWTVIYFDPAGGDRTRLRVVSLGFGDDEESQRMRAFFERGNAATLRQLQQRFAPTQALAR